MQELEREGAVVQAWNDGDFAGSNNEYGVVLTTIAIMK